MSDTLRMHQIEPDPIPDSAPENNLEVKSFEEGEAVLIRPKSKENDPKYFVEGFRFQQKITVHGEEYFQVYSEVNNDVVRFVKAANIKALNEHSKPVEIVPPTPDADLPRETQPAILSPKATEVYNFLDEAAKKDQEKAESKGPIRKLLERNATIRALAFLGSSTALAFSGIGQAAVFGARTVLSGAFGGMATKSNFLDGKEEKALTKIGFKPYQKLNLSEISYEDLIESVATLRHIATEKGLKIDVALAQREAQIIDEKKSKSSYKNFETIKGMLGWIKPTHQLALAAGVLGVSLLGPGIPLAASLGLAGVNVGLTALQSKGPEHTQSYAHSQLVQNLELELANRMKSRSDQRLNSKYFETREELAEEQKTKTYKGIAFAGVLSAAIQGLFHVFHAHPKVDAASKNNAPNPNQHPNTPAADHNQNPLTQNSQIAQPEHAGQHLNSETQTHQSHQSNHLGDGASQIAPVEHLNRTTVNLGADGLKYLHDAKLITGGAWNAVVASIQHHGINSIHIDRGPDGIDRIVFPGDDHSIHGHVPGGTFENTKHTVTLELNHRPFDQKVDLASLNKTSDLGRGYLNALLHGDAHLGSSSAVAGDLNPNQDTVTNSTSQNSAIHLSHPSDIARTDTQMNPPTHDTSTTQAPSPIAAPENNANVADATPSQTHLSTPHPDRQPAPIQFPKSILTPPPIPDAELPTTEPIIVGPLNEG